MLDAASSASAESFRGSAAAACLVLRMVVPFVSAAGCGMGLDVDAEPLLPRLSASC